MINLILRLISALHILLYRRSGGKILGRAAGLPVLLLTTTGRKTGKLRTHPLCYFEHDGGYVIIGSKGGSDTHPAWFHNLQSQPRAAIQVGGRQLEVSAQVVGAVSRGLLWARLVKMAPLYALYARRTCREIPLVLLRPVEA
jgi:deazaflavin-dependent oxidoreductase (nitroreductase family)